MNRCGSLWAVGFDGTIGAAVGRDGVPKLAREKHNLVLLAAGAARPESPTTDATEVPTAPRPSAPD